MENDEDMMMSDEDDFSDASIDILGDDDLNDIKPAAAPGWFELHPAQYFMARTYGSDSAKTLEEHRSEQQIYGNRPVVNDGTHDSLKDPHIRLLKVKPAQLGKPVHCDLLIRPLLDAPSYRAISYAWGDQDITGIVFIGPSNLSYKTSQHLWEALNRLRDESEPVYIWVDALCINQQHSLDKSTQVQIMAQIYDQAEEVRVWLGNIDAIDVKNLPDIELFWTLCRNDNPWWTRLWIVQECAYARRCPVVMIGKHNMTLEEMVRRWTEVTSSVEGLPYEQERRQILKDNLSSLRMPYEAWQMQVEKAKHRLPLITRLRMTAGRRYTVPHDRIYALLNLVDEAEARQIPPDYGKPYDVLQGEVEELLKKSPQWKGSVDAILLAHSLPPDSVDATSLVANRIHASLIEAATKRGDVDGLQDLLRIKYFQDREHYGPALCVACEYGRMDLVSTLLDQIKGTSDGKDRRDAKPVPDGSDVLDDEVSDDDVFDDRHDSGHNFLEAAARNGHEDVVNLILTCGVSIRPAYCSAALDQASKNGHISIVQKLLEKDVEVYQAASYAIRYGHIEVAKLLLSKNSSSRCDALMNAAKYNRLDLATWLLDSGVSANGNSEPNINSQSPLHEAASNGHTSMVKLLLDRGANVGYDVVNHRPDPIKAAASRGHIEIFKLLLDQAAIIDWAAITSQQGPQQTHRPVVREDVANLNHLLSNAVAYGQLATVKYLLEKGADPDNRPKNRGLSDLYVACAANNAAIAQALLEAGAEVNTWFEGPMAHVLHHVSYHGYLDIVRLLLNHGCNPNQKEESAHPYAIHSAAANGHTEVVKLLIEQGADMDAQGGWYGSALQAAALNLHQGTAEELLDNGAITGLSGGTYGSAMQAAVAKHSIEMVELLLMYGAEVDLDPDSGSEGSVIDIAAQRGFSSILELLLRHVAASDKPRAYEIAIAAALRGDHLDTVKGTIKDDEDTAKAEAASHEGRLAINGAGDNVSGDR